MSLRTKVFAFVLALLVLGAGLVMVVAQHDMTRTITVNEERAIDNVLGLLASDTVARWGGLLGEKAATARQARQPVIQYGAFVTSVLALFEQQRAGGMVDGARARDQAIRWLNQLDPGNGRHVVVMDNALNVLADSGGQLAGHTLAQWEDIKGRRFDAVAAQELGTGQGGFIIYRYPTDGPGRPASSGNTDNRAGTAPKSEASPATPELRYAAMTLFPPWDWIVAVSDSAHPIVEQFERQRVAMEAGIAQTVASISLAGNGFIAIIDQDGRAITPIPEDHAGLLQEQTPHGMTLNRLLAQSTPTNLPERFELQPRTGAARDSDSPWLIKTQFIKPLKWTLFAAVPKTGLARPATELRNRIGLLFLAGLVAALALAWVLASRITRPLQQLGAFARRLPESDLTLATALPAHIARLPDRHKDEVGDLAAAFIHMNAQLREKISDLVHETSRRERFESELTIARDIQMGLLPVQLPASVLEQIDLHAAMIPAKEVGGDLYDYFLLPDGRLCIAIGDVSDKGVPAALFMAVTRTLLRACAEDESDPARLMERVNTRLASNNPNMMFVTLIVGVLDLDTGLLQWANGGHPGLCRVQHNGGIITLNDRSGPACGVQPDLPYRGFSVTLDPGDMLFGYTDGITEAMDEKNQEYGLPRMLQALQQAGHNGQTAQTAHAIIDDVRTFAGNNEQSDDITVIILRRIP